MSAICPHFHKTVKNTFTSIQTNSIVIYWYINYYRLFVIWRICAVFDFSIPAPGTNKKTSNDLHTIIWGFCFACRIRNFSAFLAKSKKMLIFLDSQQFDTRYFRYIYVPHGKATNRTASARSNTATRLHFISLDAPSIIAFTLSAAVPAIAASFSTFTGSVTPTSLRARSHRPYRVRERICQ